MSSPSPHFGSLVFDVVVTAASALAVVLRAVSLSKALNLGDSWVDNRDAQYRGFRSALPALILVAAAFHLPLSHLLRGREFFVRNGAVLPLALAAPVLAVVHGPHFALLVLALVLPQYALTVLLQRRTSMRYRELAACVYPLASLLVIRRLSPRSPAGTLYPWTLSFNFIVLRLISYSIDTFRAAQAPAHNFFAFLAYLFYLPLYLAGPIMTFDDWSAQVIYKETVVAAPRNHHHNLLNPHFSAKRPCSIRPASIAVYTLRLVAGLLLMEGFIRTIYPIVLAATIPTTPYTAFDLLSISFACLLHIWLKLLIMWRFFRLWALLDGCNPPENMRRCVFNNNSIAGFWRGWHTSFNLWNVHYLYLPMGGRRTRLLNIWPIFAFVAVWHDMNSAQAAWAVMIALGMAIELAVTAFFSPFRGRIWYSHAATLGFAVLIAANMSGNMVGFAVGIDGAKTILWTMVDVKFIAITISALFVAVRVQLRHAEYISKHTNKIGQVQ